MKKTVILFLLMIFFCYPLSKIEAIIYAPSNCNDGIDNDGDGLIDFEEAFCHTDFDVTNPDSYAPYEIGEFSIDGNNPNNPTELRQLDKNGEEVAEGGYLEDSSITLQARIEDPNMDLVSAYFKVWNVDTQDIVFSDFADNFYISGSLVEVELSDLGFGAYAWKVIAVDENYNISEYVEFENEDFMYDFMISDNFSFVHITDVHLGSNKTTLANLFNHDWYESQSYPRFTDVLYEIETKITPRPEFILIGGDNVEYNNEDWLRDFRNIIEDFSNRTGIKVYFVPGNHDRYDSESTGINLEEGNLSGGNDYLKKYFEVMSGYSSDSISFFEDDFDVMDAPETGSNGFNKYNYYFIYKGIEFIGLDTGEDTGEWDLSPEGTGISDLVMNELYVNSYQNENIPKIIFTHHPVYNNGEDDDYVEQLESEDRTDSGEVAQNNGFIHNWRNFINYCNENNVQLVLSGHTHENKVFDKNGDQISIWNDIDYPLYIQTQSATKDNDDKYYHGYRVIDIIDGQAVPREAVEGVTMYEKVFADFDTSDNGLEFEVYDSSGYEVTIENQGDTVPFFARTSKRTIVYEDTDVSRFKIKNGYENYGEYDLLVQKRNEGIETGGYWFSEGYKINNPELCKNNPDCESFLAFSKEENGESISFDFRGIDIDKSARHAIEVEWSSIQTSVLSNHIDGLQFIVNDNSDTTYDRLLWTQKIDLNSPGELQVYDEEGNVTGLVDGKVKSEIPYSFYVPETETVYIFGETKESVTQNIKTKIVGLYEATYDLEISLYNIDEEKEKVFADDIPTDNKTNHQFIVDWEMLEDGQSGVVMGFDENDDGEFERYLNYGNQISSNFLIADAGGDYEGYEGEEIFFNASGSSSSNGDIIFYEWDFDGDGQYDIKTDLPEASHIYNDDYDDQVFLRVTDEASNAAVASAEVFIKNLNPKNKITYNREEMRGVFSFEIEYSDDGVLDTHEIFIDWGDGVIENINSDEFEFLFGVHKKNIFHKYENLEEYVIKYKVIDDDGGVGEVNYFIESPITIKREILSNLKSIELKNLKAQKELGKAIKNIEKSLDEKYWEDDFHLEDKKGMQIFNREKQVIKSLSKIINMEDVSSSYKDVLRNSIREIIESDIFILKIIISEKDIEIESLISQKNIDSKLEKYISSIEEIYNNIIFDDSEYNLDKIYGLWNSVRSLDFSKYSR